MISLYEFSIREDATVSKDVVIRLNIEDLQITFTFIIHLKSFLDDKSHKAELQRQILLEYEPIVILAIYSVAFVHRWFNLRLSVEIFQIKCFDRTFLFGEDDDILGNDVGVAIGVPEKSIVSFYVPRFLFGVSVNIPNEDRVEFHAFLINYDQE